MDANMRSAQGFKDTVYKGVSLKLKEKFGSDIMPKQCKNQIWHVKIMQESNLTSKSCMVPHLRTKKLGVSWDDNKKMILMGYEEYASHIQVLLVSTYLF